MTLFLVLLQMLLACRQSVPPSLPPLAQTPGPTPDEAPVPVVDWDARHEIAVAAARCYMALKPTDDAYYITLFDPEIQRDRRLLWPGWRVKENEFDRVHYPLSATRSHFLADAEDLDTREFFTVALDMAYHQDLVPAPADDVSLTHTHFSVTAVHIHATNGFPRFTYTRDGDYYVRTPVPPPTQ